jgi:hypothetical protein
MDAFLYGKNEQAEHIDFLCPIRQVCVNNQGTCFYLLVLTEHGSVHIPIISPRNLIWMSLFLLSPVGTYGARTDARDNNDKLYHMRVAMKIKWLCRDKPCSIVITRHQLHTICESINSSPRDSTTHTLDVR